MHIRPFATELFFSRYEFSTPHLLSVSDCETISVEELLALSGSSPNELGRMRLGYTEATGNPVLRESIAKTYKSVHPDEVVVLGTPVEGIFLTLHTLLEPTDEAIVLMPAYDALFNVAEHLGARVHRWDFLPVEGGWALDWEALKKLVNDRTKLLVVNFPHNPTGYLPTREEFLRLVAFAKKHDLWLFCDEIYRGLELTREALPSAADSYERSVVLSGLSKSYGLPGLRFGWVVIKDRAVRDQLVNWKHYTSICPPAPSEFLAWAALRAREVLVTRNRNRVQENVALADAFFARWPETFTWRPPMAGPVALVGVEVPSAEAYCHDLAREAGVMLLPATCLGHADTHVRFGFGRASFVQALAHYEAHLRQVDHQAKASA